jgi:tetratricopeptide (TPR) repeat protein
VGFDRIATLRKAEKLLRQGRLDAAIVEYRSVIEDQPTDWNTANTLGDLYVRSGEIDRAVVEYARVGDHLATEGFFSRSAAMYKKILKIKPDDEQALLQLGEISLRQGLLADAKAAFSNLAERRRVRGDRRGAAEARMRLGALDANDFEARRGGARAAADMGDAAAAVAQLKELSADLEQRGKPDEALDVLREAAGLEPKDADIRARLMRAYASRGDLARACEYATGAPELKELANGLLRDGREEEGLAALIEAVRLDQSDTEAGARLARAFITRGDMPRARTFLTRAVAATDPELLWTLAEWDVREGRAAEAVAAFREVLTLEPSRRDPLVILGCAVAETNVEAGFQCIDLAVEKAIQQDEWASAAAALNEFVSRVPNHIAALMRLVEICVDGGLEATMYSAQAQLADAYLVAGRGNEARVIAEDLVAREPWERANIERFRRALTLLGVEDIDALIAERLSGQSPFTSTDLFGGAVDGERDAVPEEAAPERPIELSPAEKAPPLQAPVPDGRSREGEAPPAIRHRDAAKPAAGRRASLDEVFELGTESMELESFLQPDAPAERRTEDSQGSTEIDLSAMLEDLQSGVAAVPAQGAAHAKASQASDVEGVFNELREEVKHQASAEDAAQHYKLATTYVEMGMLEEAMRALEVAVRAPRSRFEAASLLGRLHLQQGSAEQAIEWFERAAEAPSPDPEAGRGLLYELGSTLEKQGETARALAVFLELQADAGQYRDVAQRLTRLTKVQS